MIKVNEEKIAKRREILVMVKHLAYYFEKMKDELCEPYGLSSVQSTILMDVYRNQGSKVTDICKRLNKTTNTISPMINRLVTAGYLYKVTDLIDQRVVCIFLTEKATEIMENFMHDATDFTWPMFDILTNEEIDKIYDSLKLLEKVRHNDVNV